MRKTITLLISAALLLAVNARGQTVAGTFIDAVASGGNNITVNLNGTSTNVNWTVGQAVIDFPSKENDNQTQGFNQPGSCKWEEDTAFVWSLALDSLGNSLGYYIITDTNYNVVHTSANWCVTSVYENPDNTVDGIEIYPNPAAEVLTVVIPETLNPTSVASFFDINGRLAQQVSITANRQQMEVSNLTPGMYFIIINAKNGQQLSTHKLIKK